MNPTRQTDPASAVGHPDPYPYYADLVANRPVYWDETLGVWVVSSAQAVNEVLASDCCLVRPARAPVPPHLSGSVAGQVFGELVRMNDGPRHASRRAAVLGAIGAIDGTSLTSLSERMADLMGRQVSGIRLGAALENFAFSLPLHVMGTLVGLPEAALGKAGTLVGEFTRGLNPAADAAVTLRASSGVRRLMELIGRDSGVVGRLATELGPDTAIANVMGLLFQTFEATAALVGNSIVRLARDLEVRALVDAHPERLPEFVAESLRAESPVQNTRRFVSREVVIDGHRLGPAESILVVLAAANRDPAVNRDPAAFLVDRPDRTLFTFGVGRHGCPGTRLATAIAVAAIASLMRHDRLPRRLTGAVAYRPSPNVRMPALELLGFE